jgi:hypothetical protein
MTKTHSQIAAKEQAIRLAKLITASTSVTPIGFATLCRCILRDRRSEDFATIYGEPPVFRSSPRGHKTTTEAMPIYGVLAGVKVDSPRAFITREPGGA